LSSAFSAIPVSGRTNAEAVRVPKTAELVAKQIRNAIIRGELSDGDTLPAEAHLIAEFEVSRPTIREAVRILESEGLVTVARGARGGARISSPNYGMIARAAGITLQAKGVTIGDLYEMRTMMEPPAARLVAERNSVAAVPVLREILARQESNMGDLINFAIDVAEFHKAMIEFAGNQTLIMMWQALGGLIAEHLKLAQRHGQERSEPAMLEKRRRYGMRSQKKLVDLIEARDGAAAEAHWRDHMIAAGKVWLDVVGPNSVVDLIG
jgi:DNA-binding FadR family transcriptional regulator